MFPMEVQDIFVKILINVGYSSLINLLPFHMLLSLLFKFGMVLNKLPEGNPGLASLDDEFGDLFWN